MATSFVHNYREFSPDAIKKRVSDMVEIRENIDAKNAHVKFSFGNRKTGALVPSVSLIPVADCGNCGTCSRGCYDVRNVCFQRTVQNQRANNSAVYRADSVRYFAEIDRLVKGLRFFRWHVGGDIKNAEYFCNMVLIARNNPRCEFLAFTKMYDIVNTYIAENGALPENLHVIFSDWRGAEFVNPYSLPVSSPLWSDGSRGPHCTEKIIKCTGDCSACAVCCSGCWGAGAGDTILFEAH